MQDTHQLQAYVLEEISKRFPKKNELVDTLAALLSVGKDGIYRRLRGDTLLTPNEIELLSRHYNISLDAFIYKNSDAVFFTFNPFSQKVKTFEDYLSGIHEDLKQLHRLPEAHVFYASAEIPFFYYMFYPDLISFKLYVWGRTVWNFDYLQNQPFSLDLINPLTLDKANEVVNLYRQLPSTELWSLNIMDNTLNQLEYYAQSGGFKKVEDAVFLCKKLLQLADFMQNMAAAGRKMRVGSSGVEGTEFRLYHNEMIYTNNTILISSSVGRALYTTLGNPNFLKTTDARMCLYTEGWFKNVIAKSNLISEQGEKGRNWFFDRLRRRIEAAKNRIEMLSENDF